MAKRISFTRPRFDLELAVSDSWPPLWSLTSENGEKHYFLLAVTGWTQDGFHSASLMLGPFFLSLTVFTGEL